MIGLKGSSGNLVMVPMDGNLGLGQGNILFPDCVSFVRTPYFGGTTDESSIAPGERLSRGNRLRRPAGCFVCGTAGSRGGDYEVLHCGRTSQRARGNQRRQRPGVSRSHPDAAVVETNDGSVRVTSGDSKQVEFRVEYQG